jgi:hypothetical protein
MFSPRRRLLAALALLTAAIALPARPPKEEPRYPGVLKMDPPHIRTEGTVKYDFDIVHVRAPRKSPDGRSRWAEVGDPRTMEPGADLMLLHPDGSEEVLGPVTGNESIADPQVSLDGQSVYFAKMHDAEKRKGADIYKVNVSTRRITRLKNQEFTPNSPAVPRPAWGVFNLGPCPMPGGRIAFVSDRNGFKASNPGYAPNALALQLFTMDDDGRNVECIGHLNLGMALHPVMLQDGRLMFSSLESQGLRSHHLCGVRSIRPDGTAGRGEERQGEAAVGRGQVHDRPLDRPRLPDRSVQGLRGLGTRRSAAHIGTLRAEGERAAVAHPDRLARLRRGPGPREPQRYRGCRARRKRRG